MSKALRDAGSRRATGSAAMPMTATFLRSMAAGERVMASVTGFLEGRLRLKVNRQKSAVAAAGDRQFLGHRLGRGDALASGARAWPASSTACARSPAATGASRSPG